MAFTLKYIFLVFTNSPTTRNSSTYFDRRKTFPFLSKKKNDINTDIFTEYCSRT